MTFMLVVVLLESVECDQLENFFIFIDGHLLQALLCLDFLRVLPQAADRLAQELFDVVSRDNCFIRVNGSISRLIAILALIIIEIQFLRTARAPLSLL